MRLLGGGSNILVRDEGVAGMVISLAAPAFCEITVDGQVVTAGGGAKLGHAISIGVREGLAGLETLVGIPGTVGGALHGNAGSRGGDIGQWTRQAMVMTRAGEIVERSSARNWSSRIAKARSTSWSFSRRSSNSNSDDPEELTKRMQKQWIVKKANQPLGHQSAGCIFKNPRGMSAGMLIEQAGLKGSRQGQAEVSDRHANFIVAEAGATSGRRAQADRAGAAAGLGSAGHRAGNRNRNLVSAIRGCTPPRRRRPRTRSRRTRRCQLA